MVDREDSTDEVFLLDGKTFALDRRCRQRRRITRQIAKVKNRIGSLFHWPCPGLTNCFADKYVEVAIAFYRRYANPLKAKRLELEGITTGSFTGRATRIQSLFRGFTRQCWGPVLSMRVPGSG